MLCSKYWLSIFKRGKQNNVNPIFIICELSVPSIFRLHWTNHRRTDCEWFNIAQCYIMHSLWVCSPASAQPPSKAVFHRKPRNHVIWHHKFGPVMTKNSLKGVDVFETMICESKQISKLRLKYPKSDHPKHWFENVHFIQSTIWFHVIRIELLSSIHDLSISYTSTHSHNTPLSLCIANQSPLCSSNQQNILSYRYLLKTFHLQIQ